MRCNRKFNGFYLRGNEQCSAHEHSVHDSGNNIYFDIAKSKQKFDRHFWRLQCLTGHFRSTSSKLNIAMDDSREEVSYTVSLKSHFIIQECVIAIQGAFPTKVNRMQLISSLSSRKFLTLAHLPAHNYLLNSSRVLN